MLALIEEQKLIAEGAGAVAVAAAMFNKIDIKGKKVICLISGGNIDVTILSRVITRGLVKAGRVADMVIELADKPGQLREIASIIAEHGGNVIHVRHDHGGLDTDIVGCYLSIQMETRNHQHVEEIYNAISSAGYKIISSGRVM